MIFLAPYSVGRHGVSQAPHAILSIRNGETYYHKSVAELPVHHYDAEVTADNLHKLLKGYDKYLVLGGDHSITLGILRAKCESRGQVHLVMFDAHSDDYTSDDVERIHKLHSGNWLKLAMQEGLVSGVTWKNYRKMALGDQYNKPPKDSLNVHVSIDIDVLEPSEIGWATPYPEVGGCSLTQLLSDIAALRFASGANVSADLVEYDPTRDASRAGGQAASKITTALLDVIGA